MKTRFAIAVVASCLILAWVAVYRTRQHTSKLSSIEPRPQPNPTKQRKPRIDDKQATRSRMLNVNSNKLSTAARPATNQVDSSINNMVESRHTQKSSPIPNATKTKDPVAGGSIKTTPLRKSATPPPVRCLSNKQAKIKSTWFASKVNTNVPLFLNKVNSTVTGPARKWWLSNMHRRDTGLDAVIWNLLTVVPGLSSLRKNDASCITCAIVGNARNLKGSGYGKLIDSKDFVIRSNRSPTKGFEKDVGAVTTHQIIYPESADYFHPGATMLALPFKDADMRWLASIFTTKDVTSGFWRHVPASLSGASPEKMFTIHPAFLYYVQIVWLSNPHGKWPSAGDVALILGLHICDELHVMGFGVSKSNLWDHYYNDGGQPVTQIHHPVIQEANLRKNLQQDRIIHLYPGNA